MLSNICKPEAVEDARAPRKLPTWPTFTDAPATRAQTRLVPGYSCAAPTRAAHHTPEGSCSAAHSKCTTRQSLAARRLSRRVEQQRPHTQCIACDNFGALPRRSRQRPRSVHESQRRCGGSHTGHTGRRCRARSRRDHAAPGGVRAHTGAVLRTGRRPSAPRCDRPRSPTVRVQEPYGPGARTRPQPTPTRRRLHVPVHRAPSRSMSEPPAQRQ